MRTPDSRSTTRALALVALLLVLPGSAGATVPGQVDFQGLLLDAGGQPVNGAVSLDFTLYDALTGGTASWTESHASVQVVEGVYNVALGSQLPLTPALLSGGSVFLEITVDGETLAPRRQLLAVPYALRAAEADNVGLLTPFVTQQILENFDFDGQDPPNLDPKEGFGDVDGDGIANFVDPDNDDDGLSDSFEELNGSDLNLVTPTVTGFAPPSATAATQSTVTVQGTSFDQPGLAVSFGTQTPTPTNVTPTSFDVLVGPQPPGTVPVAVSLGNGELAQTSYSLDASLAIANVSPSIIPFDSATVLTVTGTSLDLGISVTFDSSPVTPTNVTPTSFQVSVGPGLTQGQNPLVVSLPNGEQAQTNVSVFGETFIVFVTSTTYPGDFGGIVAGDAACAARAAAAGLPETYIAWVSEGDDPALRLIGALGLLKLTDGTIVGNRTGSLQVTAPIDLDEFGNPVSSSVWTGGGSLPGQNCVDWTIGNTGAFGLVGTTSDGPTWDSAGITPCDAVLPLFCVEQ